ncbi:MAG: hypothetical protein A2600_11460 [Candidatus Lambdaproteobacteria bacterium RIFOXYD1_FULL_56_27]|uniref:Uncharacterized protein n=1 Tax=Candidatus Lambdaproteobacteria bacterium RIFOXYD2_FULL_56_26 TaxID=1817773 RepID=A0A1F6H0R2_9PROT|nr:MAG: hypothetical protein A2426_12540 [Candidatus Lambdaproteobacteria bacterium RIFOXYC1_FULL_56_13]OGH03988.1 MAG: hypothetical protein A2557_11220 [Candidatus Lambdaproteobacteria bacterium RIFOXYD2_FULL_56_26]OGH08379.1 MAG: hypothetical protein A2600_11460 [Candidatus Lambdaproteobacteria bacterium RIFOXYD1_FULL_56_27]
MKPNFWFLTIALLGLSLNQAFAMPKYTDKENAMALARVLDKGSFGRFTVASTYVQNESPKDYYVSVILSDGSSQKWYVDQIFNWSREDKLLLSENRSLLFLDPRDTRFVLLDKNVFHRQALQANVYVKLYGNGDTLEGQKFQYQIKSFNLISPNETAFGRDETGSQYRYIVDLMNGTSELLTYEDAYRLLKNNFLLTLKDLGDDVLSRAYQVTKVVPTPKGPVEDGVAQFGVEIQFDQNIALSGENFPIEIYERKLYNQRTKEFTKEFVMDITIPNSEKTNLIRPITSLEFLNNVEVVKSSKYPKRTFLRASFNPDVMDIPPVVYKNSDTSVYVNFFALIDQTVISRGMLLEEKERKALERETFRTIRVKKAIKSDSDYGRAFIAGLETQKNALAIKDEQARIEKLLEAIRQFEESALYAESDAQLYNALTKRNQLRENVITLTMELIESRLKQPNFGGSSPKTLLDQLERAESFTGNPDVLKSIEQAREKLIAAQE